MTIKFSSIKGNQSRVVRETTAPFVIVEKDVERTEQLRVQYYSLIDQGIEGIPEADQRS
jgi:hypothetical protein